MAFPKSQAMTDLTRTFDILVVGGGINGVGIACDAAGRGLDVLLCEQGDLGGCTSSASSKMIHGGLRYLEHYEFRLVREALSEREVLYAKAPHLIRPMRLLLPYVNAARPAWMIRIGLFLYDHLSARQTLPGCDSVDLKTHAAGSILRPEITLAFAYSDCRVDDARLVIANAMAARNHGATIRPRHRVLHAERRINRWHATLKNTDNGEISEVTSKVLINAAGPEVETFLNKAMRKPEANRVRLVKGSHIVVPRVFDGPEAFIFQNTDGRVIFVIPFQEQFSLIGTTDVPVETPEEGRQITAAETAYLCDSVNSYLREPITAEQVVWSYAGVRPLFDDGKNDPSDVTRDYILELDAPVTGAPLLSVFGGKLTTYRRLAEAVLEEIASFFPDLGPPWTAHEPLPGGDMGIADLPPRLAELEAAYPEIPKPLLNGLLDRHGTTANAILGDARTLGDLGENFGAGLTAREVDHMIANEWASTCDDILWRRSKAGLHLNPEGQEALKKHMAKKASKAA